MSYYDDMKADMTGMAVDAILSEKKVQDMLKIADPFIKPSMKGILKQLGPDDKRFMIYFDNASGLLCFLTMKTANIKEFQVEGIEKGDLFTVDPADIEKGNLNEVIKAIIKKTGMKL